MTQTIHIEEIHQDKSKICRDILQSLPEWFGIPESIDEYIEGVKELTMLVAKDHASNIIGFIALKPQTNVGR